MKRSIVLVLLLSGCGGLQVLPRDGGPPTVGEFNATTKSLAIIAGDKRFSGNYITNAGTSTSFGTGYAGTKSAFGTGQSFHSGNAGTALLVAPDGDTMRCEFQYQGMTAIGVCQDRAGKIYDFRTN